MKQTATASLHRIDRDGRAMLAGDVAGVAVSIDCRTGHAQFDYPSDTRATSLQIDTIAKRFTVHLAPTRRLLALRRQSMRKGCTGWKHMA